MHTLEQSRRTKLAQITADRLDRNAELVGKGCDEHFAIDLGFVADKRLTGCCVHMFVFIHYRTRSKEIYVFCLKNMNSGAVRIVTHEQSSRCDLHRTTCSVNHPQTYRKRYENRL